MTDPPSTTISWARQHGRAFHWQAALDNYSPARSYATGEGWEFRPPQQGEAGGIVLDGARILRFALRAVYLIDDGDSVRPFYVVCFGPGGEDPVVLHQFPLVGDPASHSVLVDPSAWHLGPRPAYHLKAVRHGEHR